MAAAAVLLALVGLNRAGVRRLTPYLLLGAALWVAVVKSGVHATLAGVVLAMCIPLKGGDAGNGGQRAPLGVLEHALHPWVAYVVLPVFALASGIVGYLWLRSVSPRLLPAGLRA